MTRRMISAYTPSNTDPKRLKRIFVQRHRLLKKLVGRLTRSMTSADKHHTILVGPRGSGKTHLVSLAEYELRNRPELTNLMRIAWLGENDTIAGMVDLAFAIAGRLAHAYPDEFAKDYREAVRGLSPDDAAESALSTVIERLGARNIVLIMENMDRAFDGLGDLGRKKWRAFLQEHRRIAILGTSQQLFNGISSRDEAFFGFFDIHHLKALTVEDAQELILKISTERGNDELSQFLRTPEGSYRVRALHHLVGGNHRLYVLLSEFLTKDSLDDLVEPIERLAEELTPYFQDRIRSLAPQQAKIVECLCNATGAMTVKEVSEKTFVAERNCSKQLGGLKRKSYVRSQRRGKESFYEIAEPLMRLCLGVKHQRGRPLRLVAQYLRAWFPNEELRKGSPGSALSSREKLYRESAIDSQDFFDIVIAADLKREIDAPVSDQAYEKASTPAAELRFFDPHTADFADATIAVRNNRDYDEAISMLSAVVEMEDAPAERRALALLYRGTTHGRQGDVERQLADYTTVVEMEDAPAEQRADALYNKGTALWRAERYQESHEEFEAALSVAGAPTDIRTLVLFSLPEPMVMTSSREAMINALSTAFREGARGKTEYGGTPHILLSMVLLRGHQEWKSYIADLAPLYIENGATDKLGQGVARLIEALDAGGYSETQLDEWNAAWREAGATCEDLALPLLSLNAATEAIKAKSDRPLLRLPLEVRELIRPLLSMSLGI